MESFYFTFKNFLIENVTSLKSVHTYKWAKDKSDCKVYLKADSFLNSKSFRSSYILNELLYGVRK